MKENAKLIMLVLISIIILGLGGYVIFDRLFGTSPVIINEEVERPTTTDSNPIKEISLDDEKLTLVMDNFNSRVGYDYCSLDLKYLSEIYEGNFKVEKISKYSLLLHALAAFDISGIEYDSTFIKISDINNKLNELFLNPSYLTIQDIKNNLYGDYFNIYTILINEDSISPLINTFGCESDSDMIFTEIIKAQENNDYLYVYQNVGFGYFNEEINGVDYYKDLNKEFFVSSIIYDWTDINAWDKKPDARGFNTYKYTFKKANNNYKLVSINL